AVGLEDPAGERGAGLQAQLNGEDLSGSGQVHRGRGGELVRLVERRQRALPDRDVVESKLAISVRRREREAAANLNSSDGVTVGVEHDALHRTGAAEGD